jgi:hypothetical protein
MSLNPVMPQRYSHSLEHLDLTHDEAELAPITSTQMATVRIMTTDPMEDLPRSVSLMWGIADRAVRGRLGRAEGCVPHRRGWSRGRAPVGR